MAAAWLGHITDYCAFLLEWRDPHTYLDHGAAVEWCVLTAMPSFSDLTDLSTFGHSFKTDSLRIAHVVQYGDDVIDPDLNFDENCLVSRRIVGIEPTTFRTKTFRSVVDVEPTTFRTAATADQWGYDNKTSETVNTFIYGDMQ